MIEYRSGAGSAQNNGRTMQAVETDFMEQLSRLSQRKQLAFLLLTCVRHFHYLNEFSSETGFYISEHSSRLSEVWTFLEEAESHFKHIYADHLSPNPLPAPDTEDFDNFYTSAALNAVLLIDTAFEFALYGRSKDLREAVTLARDTAFIYSQIPNDTPSYSSVKVVEVQSGLIRCEERSELDDFEFLLKLDDSYGKDFVTAIRTRASSAIPSCLYQ